MWLKLLGASLVLVSSMMIGNLIAKNFLERTQQLRQLRHGLQILETEILYTASFLPQALLKIGKLTEAPIALLFQKTGRLLLCQEGYTAGEAWTKALEEQLASLAIKKSDQEILLQLGSFLGCSDREDQLKHLKLTQEYLQKEEIRAEKEGEKNVPLWRYLGLVAGMALIILIF